MPSDIRSFFGGKPAGTPAKQEEAPKTKAAKGRGKRVIEDDSDDDIVEVKATKVTPKRPKQRDPTPAEEETSTSSYFGNKKKPKRSEPVRAPAAATSTTPITPNGKPTRNFKTPTSKTTPVTRSSGRKKNSAPAQTNGSNDNVKILADDDFDDDGDDIFESEYKAGPRKDDYKEEECDDDEIEEIVPSRAAKGLSQRRSKKGDDDFELKSDEDMIDAEPAVKSKPSERANKEKPSTRTAAPSRKRKSLDSDGEDEQDLKPKDKAKPVKKSPVKKKTKKDDDDLPEDPEVLQILNNIPVVRAPTPPPQSGQPAKFNFRAAGNAAAPPPAAGSKDIPLGAENCLAGLSFVFTGVLNSLDRDTGKDLVKRYGGKVMTAPSTKTSFVVLGEEAGPKKLETIRKFSIKTINEDGLFELIRRLPANGGSGKAATKQAEKKEHEAQKIREMAAEMEKEDKKTQLESKRLDGKASVNNKTVNGKTSHPVHDSRLWTTKYAPTQLSQICGNKAAVEKLARWLRAFPKNQRTKFKMPGPDGSGLFRSVMIHGPPGIGKTTAAHLVAKLEGYDIVESNASDTRSKKLVENGLKGVLSTTSLLGYFAGDNKEVEESKKKLVLIMDEVDGMSAGDRGGVGALAAVCKKTQIPMILICNERRQPKMKPFDFVTYDLPFRRPTTDMIRSRIMTIAFREGLQMPGNVVDALIEGSRADIRQIVNMVSTAKLDQDAMSFEQSKGMSKAWEKHVILKPWDIISKILGGGMFAPSSKSTLNDKAELYFNDHESSYLMLQENYLGTSPLVLASIKDPKERKLEALKLAQQAAESISDGDLVDRMIHGSQQQWSLMPTHAIFSFVRPASFVAGSMAGHQTAFTQWLGKNSTQGKLTRMVKEIQGHMRLRTSADRHEIRQQYMPLLWRELVNKLQVEGKDAVDNIIDLMDSYFLTKDDFDAIMELGVGPMDMERVKIETQAKATFTRLYNQRSHPMPFMKASNVIAPKQVSKVKPDLEEALDESDEGEVLEDAKPMVEDDVDISKDKYIKQPKKTKAATSKAGKGKGKKAAADDDDDEEHDKPKRGKGAARGKGRGRN